MKKLLLVCGPAAIGKSTYSKGYASRHPKEAIYVIAADEVRKDLYGGYDKFPPYFNMTPVYKEMISRAKKLALEHDELTVVFDTTMLYDERRLYFIRHLKEFNFYEMILLKLNDYSKCLERNKARPKEKWVPDNIIMDMASHYEMPSPYCLAHFNKVVEIYVDNRIEKRIVIK